MERELEELAAEAARVLGGALRSNVGAEVSLALHEWFDEVDPRGSRPAALFNPLKPLQERFSLPARQFSESLNRANDQQVDRLRELIGQYGERVDPAPTDSAPTDLAPPDRVTTLTSMLVGAKLEQPPPTAADEQPPTHDDHIDFRNATFHGPVTGTNITYSYSYTPSLLHNLTPPPNLNPDTWLTLGDADPLALGIRGASRLKEWSRLTEYVNRDVEASLEGWFEEDGLLVVRGRQFAGKTRTAWEALFVELPPEARVCTPNPGTDLRALPGILAGRPGRYVLWLDDLDAHLTQRDLDTALLAELKRAGVPVVGTMNDTVYEAHMAAADTLAHRVLALARVERLSTAWSKPELRRAGDSADPRLVEALEWRGDTGVTQYLALAPLFAETVRGASGAGSGCRPHQGLLLAALDLVRCGLRDGIPRDLVAEMSLFYSHALVHEDAWDKVFAPVHDITGLLLEGPDDTCRPYGSLIADALRDPPDSVPMSIWRHALKSTTADAQHAVRSTARAHFTRLAEAGKRDAMHMLGLIKEADGDQETALHWYRKAADAGLHQVAEQVGRLLLTRGAPDEALPYLRTATDRTPTPTAPRLLAEAHLALAEQALRKAADLGDNNAPHLLGELDLRLADASRAAQYHLRLHEDDDVPTARSLAVYHLLRGETETAQPYLERAIHDGDDRAVRILDDIRAEPQSLDDAEEHFRHSRDPQDIAHLGVVLEKTGRTAEALTQYDRAAAHGDPFARTRAEALRRKRDTVEE
ncbi:tetratricopeptide repeat protein [Streptomyces sp. S6]